MKKILIFLFTILLILSGLFYKEIIATKDFYVFQQNNHGIFTKATINWEQISFTSTGRSGLADETITFNNLQLSIPFTATKKEGGDSAFALGATQSISISKSKLAANFFPDNNFSSEEKTQACRFLNQSSGIGACTSNYNLYRAWLESNNTDIHVFSSISDKNIYTKLITIRSTTLNSNTLSAFETRQVMGFLFTIDTTNYIAHIFDNQDQMYEVVFTNLEEAEVAFVLSNINYIK